MFNILYLTLKYTFQKPLEGLWVIWLSLCVQIFSLTLPVFAVLVVQKYITVGIDETLWSLFVAGSVGVFFEFVFRQIRKRKLNRLSDDIYKMYSDRLIACVYQYDHRSFEKEQKYTDFLQQGIENKTFVQRGFSGLNLGYGFDLMSSLLYLLIVYLILPEASLILLCGLVVVMIYQTFHYRSLLRSRDGVHVAEKEMFIQLQTPFSLQNRGQWLENIKHRVDHAEQKSLDFIKVNIHYADLGGQFANLTIAFSAMFSLLIYAYGAYNVHQGFLGIGTLIALNIIALKAVAPFFRYTELRLTMEDAQKAIKALHTLELWTMRLNKKQRSPRVYDGLWDLHQVTTRDVYHDKWLFKPVSIVIDQGDLVAVVGDSGSGRTAFLRYFTGVLSPSMGRILLDENNLERIKLSWLRDKVCMIDCQPYAISGMHLAEYWYLSEEDMEDPEDRLDVALKAAGLKSSFDRGLFDSDMSLDDMVKHESPWTWWRINLVRALLNKQCGMILIDDVYRFNLSEVKAILEPLLLQWSSENISVIMVSQSAWLLERADKTVYITPMYEKNRK